MLLYRLIFGPLMIVALLLVAFFDDQLDRIVIADTWLQPVFLGREYLPAGLLTLACFLTLIVLNARELARIFRAKGIAIDGFLVALCGLTGCVLFYLTPYELDAQVAVALTATLMLTLLIGAIVRHSWVTHQTQGAVAVASVTVFSFFYLGMLPGFFVAVRRFNSAWVLLAVLLIAKSCDIGAYFTGRAIGKRKLAPWISPGKTLEGLIGGVAFSAVVAALLAVLNDLWPFAGAWQTDPLTGERTFVPTHFEPWRCAVGGALMGVAGQFGDLMISLLKRDAGLKDSGGSIPGFGGLLDVVDSPLMVAPLAYWLLMLSATSG